MLSVVQVRRCPSSHADGASVQRVHHLEERNYRVREEATLPGDDLQEQPGTYREDPIRRTVTRILTNTAIEIEIGLHRQDLHHMALTMAVLW